jgi:hypothetical protein
MSKIDQGSVEIVARDTICLSQIFKYFLHFETIWASVRLHINEIYMGKWSALW